MAASTSAAAANEITPVAATEGSASVTHDFVPEQEGRASKRQRIAEGEIHFAQLPDDFHHHLRDGPALRDTVPAVSRYFARAIAMPNLKPPVVTTEDALAYYDRIMQHVPEGRPFKPLMTLYLTDQTTPEEIVKAKACGKVSRHRRTLIPP